MSDSTVPERQPARAAASDSDPSPGLVVVWYPNGRDHIGAWLPVGDGTWILGRGAARGDDLHPRLPLIKQRPGVNLPLPALEAPPLSRVQLLCRATSKTTLLVENVGRCALSLNGRVVRQASLSLGDVVEVGNQVTFVCTARPTRLPGDPRRQHAFGELDEHGFVGESSAAWQLRHALAFAAPRPLHVLVWGESGTGKELVARALHAASRRTGPLVSRNAATLPETLVEAELFGNADGYPNPGMKEHKGLIGAAHGGTLFLDEVAELPLSQQTRLLRVLDEGEYHRLGETSPRRVDLRVIGATNQPLSSLRGDVLTRFGLTINVPNLASRREDIPLLVRQILRVNAARDPALVQRFFEASGEPRLSQALVSRLVQRPPPGNVRGLQAYLWRALAESPLDALEAPRDDEPPPLADSSSHAEEGARLQEVLNAHAGSLERTWRALGLSSRFALMRLMKKHGIRVKKQAEDPPATKVRGGRG